MKNSLTTFTVVSLLFVTSHLFAQVGIGTATPDASAMLEIASTSKGLLMPRLTTVQRDAMTLPASGLMIFNSTQNDGQINVGTPASPNWIGIKGQESPLSVSESSSVSVTSTSYTLLTGFTISPPEGAYIGLFNAQLSNESSFSTAQGVTDLNSLYTYLMGVTGGTSHALVFGNAEVLTPGIYDVTGAPSIANTLTFDGGGDTNSLFIIRATGAFTTGASSIVYLINGARAKNIFWVSEVAMSTGATTTMKGNLIAHNGAIALGADTDLEGRVFSLSGAITTGANSILHVPDGTSDADLGVLQTFIMFSGSGAISGCATCTLTGNVGTALGATSAFSGISGSVYSPGSIANDPDSTSFRMYQNGSQVAYSTRISASSHATVSMQAAINITAGDEIQIRWKVNKGEATLIDRNFALIRTGN